MKMYLNSLYLHKLVTLSAPLRILTSTYNIPDACPPRRSVCVCVCVCAHSGKLRWKMRPRRCSHLMFLVLVEGHICEGMKGDVITSSANFAAFSFFFLFFFLRREFHWGCSWLLPKRDQTSTFPALDFLIYSGLHHQLSFPKFLNCSFLDSHSFHNRCLWSS